MLTNKWISRAAIGLVATIAMVAATATSALAAGPEAHVIVVHVTDGSGVTPADQEPDPQSDLVEEVDFSNVEADLYIHVNQAGVSAYGFTDDGGGWGAGPDGVHDEQRQLGDTATGLLSAGRNCQDDADCHIILVNYRQPASREHRVAAKAAAEELAAAGHKLHAVAVGPDGASHLGFNWHLSGQAFNAEADEADELINKVAGYVHIADNWGGPTGLTRDWHNLSQIEKIWLNPSGCDLATQWMWSSDASCHDKR